MEDRKHILLVANTLSKAEVAQIQETLNQMRREGMNTKVSVLYVKPYLPSCYVHVPSMISVAEDFEEEAKESLHHISKQLNVPAENQWIATGRVKPETLKISATLGIDYILASNSVNKALNHAISFKKNNFQLPVKNINNLAA
mgnify:CR=1 FL=1